MSATTAREPEAIDAWLVPWFAPRPVFEVWSRSVDSLCEASLATQDALLEVWRPYAEQADRVAQAIAAQLHYSALDLLEQLDQARARTERAEATCQRLERSLARERERAARAEEGRAKAEANLRLPAAAPRSANHVSAAGRRKPRSNKA